jgi:hypothetical protein
MVIFFPSSFIPNGKPGRILLLRIIIIILWCTDDAHHAGALFCSYFRRSSYIIMIVHWIARVAFCLLS